VARERNPLRSPFHESLSWYVPRPILISHLLQSSKLSVHTEVCSYYHAINFANDRRFGLAYMDHTRLEGNKSVWEERGKHRISLSQPSTGSFPWRHPHVTEFPNPETNPHPSGFGGLVISMLASGTQVHGFKRGRSRRPHVAALRHIKEPYNYRGSRNCKAKFDWTHLTRNSTFRW
jgi:hypothetical protein